MTGAANGIGLAIARRLSATGWSVVGVDREPLEAEMSRLGGVGIVGDVRDLNVLSGHTLAAEECAGLHAWVNNAGIVCSAPLHVMAPEVITQVLEIDLLAVIYGTAPEALRSFLAHGVGGTIVNISSIHARISSFPGCGPYDPAKGGVETLTRYVCVGVGHLGIRCNAVSAGCGAHRTMGPGLGGRG